MQAAGPDSKISRPNALGRAFLAGVFVVAASLAGGCRAEPSWPLWDSYTQRFLDGQGRVIDHSEQDRTTSEGQSYAMFFALVANDRPRFDKLVQWTETNLAGGDLTERLPAWSWGQAPDGSWKVLDSNSAADSDLWIAYSLIEAGRLWHDPRYDALGRAVAARIAQEEVAFVPGLGTTLIAGNRGFHPSADTWIVNPSYLPLPVLTRLARLMPEGPWLAVASSLGPILARGSASGFAMDWVAAGSGVRPIATPADFTAQRQNAPILGSYDAIRVYLWLGIADRLTPGRSDLLDSISGMAEYLKSQGLPPARVDSAGKIVESASPVGFSAAVAPYLAAMGMTAQAQVLTARVAAARNPATGLYGNDARYYDQNLVLFATGWQEQRYRFDSRGMLVVRWK